MVIIQTMLPMTFPLVLTNDAAFKTLVEMLCLVVGGTMSTSALMRSYKFSSAESSEEIEEIDSCEE